MDISLAYQNVCFFFKSGKMKFLIQFSYKSSCQLGILIQLCLADISSELVFGTTSFILWPLQFGRLLERRKRKEKQEGPLKMAGETDIFPLNDGSDKENVTL